MPNQISLSVVIITYNEEKNIKRCIDSVIDIADEIIIVDSYSTDRTKEICSAFNIRFIEHEFHGHIEQKNYAKSQAKYDYVLSLDADECLDEQAIESLLKVKSHCVHNGYILSRRNNYCGQWIYHSGWYPDRKLRLWNRHLGSWCGDNPHDKFIMHDASSTCPLLDGHIDHYTYYTTEEHVKQSEKFARISAQTYFNKKKKYFIAKEIYSAIYKWFYVYIIRLGFLDGKAGWHIARISARANYIKYKLLSEHWKNKPA